MKYLCTFFNQSQKAVICHLERFFTNVLFKITLIIPLFMDITLSYEYAYWHITRESFLDLYQLFILHLSSIREMNARWQITIVFPCPLKGRAVCNIMWLPGSEYKKGFFFSTKAIKRKVYNSPRVWLSL